MKPKLLISFSGGRTSAYMTWLLLRNMANTHDILVVFANTGKEREQTLEFIRNCDIHFGFNTVWVEAVVNPAKGKGVSAKVVDFNSAARNGEPFEAMIQKYGIPNSKYLHCTRELKERSIRAYARQINFKQYHTAIGIRTDEMDRINFSRAKNDKLIYPLTSIFPTSKLDVNDFWKKQQFDLQLKSYEGNCDFCWKKSLRKLMTIAVENPLLLKWWEEMEQKYDRFIPAGRKGVPKSPVHFFRNNLSVQDIVDLAKQPFEHAEDDSRIIPTTLDGQNISELDKSIGCEESCEAFN